MKMQINDWNKVDTLPALHIGVDNWERVFEIKSDSDEDTLELSLDKDMYENTGALCFKGAPENIMYWREIV